MRAFLFLLFLVCALPSAGQKYKTTWLEGVEIADSLQILTVSSDTTVSRISIVAKGRKGVICVLITDRQYGSTWSTPYLALKLRPGSLHGRLTADGNRIMLVKEIDERTGEQTVEVRQGVIASTNFMGVYVSELLSERSWSTPRMFDDYFFFNGPPHSISMSPDGKKFIFSNLAEGKKKAEMMNYSTGRNEQNKWVESSRFEIRNVQLAERVKGTGLFAGSVIHQNDTTLLVTAIDGAYSVPFDNKKAGTPKKIDFFGGAIQWMNPSGSVGLILGQNPSRVGLIQLDKSTSKTTSPNVPPVVNVERDLVGSNSDDATRVVKPTGKYYAVLIGVSDYERDDLNLERPVKDVEDLARVLTQYYSFDPENVQILTNPTRQQILNRLFSLRTRIGINDNLLIFYAGHGHFDQTIKQGYWWPRDASPNDPSNWLSNSDLREQIRGIKSAHTLLISDACFSGGIFRSRGVEEVRNAPKEIISLYRTPSRRAITSGNLSSVPDRSVFFEYLMKRLTSNEEKYLPSQQLFAQLKMPVMNNSSTIPQDGVITDAGDEGGDFIFIHK